MWFQKGETAVALVEIGTKFKNYFFFHHLKNIFHFFKLKFWLFWHQFQSKFLDFLVIVQFLKIWLKPWTVLDQFHRNCPWCQKTSSVLLKLFFYLVLCPKDPFFTSHFQWNFDSFKQFQFFFFWNWSETANSLNQRIQNRITASKTYLFNKNWVSKNCYFSDFWWKKMRCQKKKDSKMSAIFFKNAIHFCVLKLLNTNFRHASKSR